MQGIQVPTLILRGKEDKFQLMKYGERLAWDIPGAHLICIKICIKEARHFVMFDRPEEVAQRLSAFLGVQ